MEMQCIIRRVALEPGHVADLRHSTGHHQELVFFQPRDRKISLNATPLIAPLGIDNTARLNVHIVGADVIQHFAGIAAFNRIFGE